MGRHFVSHLQWMWRSYGIISFAKCAKPTWKLFKPTADLLRICCRNSAASFTKSAFIKFPSHRLRQPLWFFIHLATHTNRNNKSQRIDAHSLWMLITYSWLNLIRRVVCRSNFQSIFWLLCKQYTVLSIPFTWTNTTACDLIFRH